MPQQTLMRALAVSLLLTAVLSARIDDPEGALNQQPQQHQELLQEQDQQLEQEDEQLQQQDQQLEQHEQQALIEGGPPAYAAVHSVAAGPAVTMPSHLLESENIERKNPVFGEYWGQNERGTGYARTKWANLNTLESMDEAKAARSSTAAMASNKVQSAMATAGKAVALANAQAVAHNQRTVTQGQTQTIAQRRAQELARSHAYEAAEAHKNFVEATENEKIHAQEAKLAHAEAVTEKRAIEVHKKAEQRIKDVELKRAEGIRDINAQADSEVRATHFGALRGIEEITAAGKDEVMKIKTEHPATHKTVNEKVEADAKEGSERWGAPQEQHRQLEPVLQQQPW
jgi:hypothetical protein